MARERHDYSDNNGGGCDGECCGEESDAYRVLILTGKEIALGFEKHTSYDRRVSFNSLII